MRYSNSFLDDNNFDEEIEKLCDVVHINVNDYNSFVPKLDGFWLNGNKGIEEWIKVFGSFTDYSGCQKGQLAYEFKNGFIIFDYIEVY